MWVEGNAGAATIHADKRRVRKPNRKNKEIASLHVTHNVGVVVEHVRRSTGTVLAEISNREARP